MPLGHTTNSINLPLALGANYGLIIPCHRSICEVPIDQVPFVCGYAIFIITIYSVNQLSPTLIKQFYHVEPFGVCFSTSKWARDLYRNIVIINNVMWFSTFEITPTQFKFVHYLIYTAFYCSTIQGDVLSLRLNLLQHRFGTIPTSSSLTKVEHEF